MNELDKINILLVDDHPVIREGMSLILRDEPFVNSIETAENGNEMIEKLSGDGKGYDLILMDIRMPEMNGIEATSYITENHPDIKVLVLSTYDDESMIVDILKAGARGYVLKNAGKSQILKAIESVMNNESYFSQEVSNKLVNKYLKDQKPGTGSEKQAVPLSRREKEILRLIVEEFTNQEIAEKLFISTRTVDTHRRNLLQKLNVKNTAGLVRYTFENNLLD